MNIHMLLDIMNNAAIITSTYDDLDTGQVDENTPKL
jgi:hypothetical protein